MPMLRFQGLVLCVLICGLQSITAIAQLPAREGIVFDGKVALSIAAESVTVNPQSFTVSAWVCPANTDAPLAFISSGSASQDFSLYYYNGVVRLLVESAPPSYAYAVAPAPTANNWTHYLGTCDGESLRIYRNGTLAGQKPTPVRQTSFSGEISIGGIVGTNRTFLGKMDEIAVWNRVLSSAEILQVSQGKTMPQEQLVVHLSPKSKVNSDYINLVDQKPCCLVEPGATSSVLINKPDTGFRGIWYYNQNLNNEYVFKYSGGLGTYCGNHYPFALYAPAVNKTFFCYGGTSEESHQNPDGKRTLLHEVSYYDHATGMVARPTLLLDKQTDDAHDNPVISLDDAGFLWVFSTSHGTGRPSYISRSKRPYDIADFDLISPTKIVDGEPRPLDNFSYFQIWHVAQQGFVAFFTTYDKSILNDPTTTAARILCFMTSRDGVHWSSWQPIAGIVHGHYQNASVWKDKKIATTFNYHPNDPPRVGLNYRTNLYYMQSVDMGENWTAVDGTPLNTPLRDGDINSPALVRDYRSLGLNVYGMDLLFDSKGNPIILYLTSKGFESGPENGPRVWHTAAWNGAQWDISDVTESDNNYDYGSLFIVSDTQWRIVGTTETGPQAFNTGGEVAMWETQDRGRNWTRLRQITQGSEHNHCYPRRTINAHPDFYAFWASGHGRKPSQSLLYFCNDRGDVFQLPERMPEGQDLVAPIKK